MYMDASDKQKISNVFNEQLKTTDKNCCSVNRFTADCKASNPKSKTDGQHKMKRLKSRRKRSQMRGVGKEALKSRSHHNHCCRQASENIAHYHNCCHNSCHCPSRSGALFPNARPAAQESSIITDSRLIGHQGLFNHEVKSIDIERLLSEQRKLEKCGQQVQKKNNATSHPSSAISTRDFLGTDEKKASPETKARDDFQDIKNWISQGADVTLGQRSQQQLDLSSGSGKSTFSSKHSPVDVIKSRKANPAVSERGREPQQIPTVDRENVNTLNKKVKGHMISTLEHTPRNQESPVHLTHGFSPSPLQVSCSNTIDNNDMQHGRQDPDCVSQFVSAVAADLCDSLQFPVLKRRSLVAESREVLLKALRESHGPHLEKNLLKVQRYLSFDTDPAKHGQHQEPTMTDEDEPLPTELQETGVLTGSPDHRDTTTVNRLLNG
uniref:uncharacterized protein si:dkey-250k15.4 isoform X2 n=1 Tax=Scatophagus argus TaxID=75038 RepID=UPI001ED80CCC|nr:uncharacterized protein si:dkey-250k15.4 isoform X2 [Scatophagus argus]